MEAPLFGKIRDFPQRFRSLWEPAAPAMASPLNRFVGFSPLKRLPHFLFAAKRLRQCGGAACAGVWLLLP